MSRNKCRICGYHFKSDDEIICPECFTARDEDISCNSLSDDLHSHDLRADNEQDGWFGQSENDTFKEEKTISFPRNVKRKQVTRISKAPIPHLKTRPFPQAIQIQEPKSLPPSITTANSVQAITAQTTAPIASTPRT